VRNPRARRRASQAEREARIAAERQRDEDWREQEVAELKTIEDVILRLVRAMRSFSLYIPHQTGYGNQGDANFTCDEEALRTLFPAYWPGDSKISLGENPPWDHEAVRMWFMRSIGKGPTDYHRVERKGVFGYREKFVAAWTFQNGSTLWSPYETFGTDRDQFGGFLDISITAGGDLLYRFEIEERDSQCQLTQVTSAGMTSIVAVISRLSNSFAGKRQHGQ
jgi:hypothetical protein